MPQAAEYNLNLCKQLRRAFIVTISVFFQWTKEVGNFSPFEDINNRGNVLLYTYVNLPNHKGHDNADMCITVCAEQKVSAYGRYKRKWSIRDRK